MYPRKKVLNISLVDAPRKSRIRADDDRQLVDDCLAGDSGSWSRLYQACHPKLWAAVASFLREFAADIDLVDEIVARVWYAVVRNEGELLSRYEPQRGCRLTTFLVAIAKSEAKQYFRSERRRKRRETLVSRTEVDPFSDSLPNATVCHDEFLSSLSPTERNFYDSVLVSGFNEESAPEYSQENAWQLRHRVRIKLNQFFE